jgi:hypothetical protein
MKLSLAIVLLLAPAAMSGVGAAPQTKAKKAEAGKAVQMVTVSGGCTKLVYAGSPLRDARTSW